MIEQENRETEIFREEKANKHELPVVVARGLVDASCSHGSLAMDTQIDLV